MSSSFRIYNNSHTWHCLSTKSVRGEGVEQAASSAECIYIDKMCVVKRRRQKPSLRSVNTYTNGCCCYIYIHIILVWRSECECEKQRENESCVHIIATRVCVCSFALKVGERNKVRPSPQGRPTIYSPQDSLYPPLGATVAYGIYSIKSYLCTPVFIIDNIHLQCFAPPPPSLPKLQRDLLRACMWQCRRVAAKPSRSRLVSTVTDIIIWCVVSYSLNYAPLSRQYPLTHNRFER